MGLRRRIAGWLILTNQIEPDQLGSAPWTRVVSQSAFWLIVFFAVAVVGMAVQLATTQEYVVMWDEEYPVGAPGEPHHPERSQHALSLSCPSRVRDRRGLPRRSQAPPTQEHDSGSTVATS